ncbi:MAG: acyl-CoA desaturase [Candidatus Poribacteria bacterium]|nr:acyl-CoA desaturase [Candidatus Poribacteria bacterium]
MSTEPGPTSPADEADIIHPRVLPFITVHLVCLAIFWVDVQPIDWIICGALYVIRMFGITAGFHRYFSHRSFKTSRGFQFFLAFLGQSSAQRGVLWWAAKHRYHHKYSDTEHDVHSPVQHGFWYSHVLWIFSKRGRITDYRLIKDFQKYPELVWLDKWDRIPPVLLGVLVWAIAGWSGLVVGFFVSTVLLFHGTFTINSLSHVIGKQPYVTGDDSRNNWLLAIITLGEGWHNNHHHFPSATPQGFRWWQIDVTYYILKILSIFRIVWDLRLPPAHVVAGKRKLSLATIENTAQQLASSFSIEQIGNTVLKAWAHTPKLEELRNRARISQAEVEAFLKEMKILELPSIVDLKHRAQKMFAHIPSLNPIVERANQILIQAVSVWLVQNDVYETAFEVS